MSNLQIKLHEHCEKAYLKYAQAVVMDRALPCVQDGLKPVHRRILFAMSNLGLSPTSKAVKSARVVGDVLGKYHPHGDQAAYDALVRMAQEFSLRYPIIDGQGNFGSRDGDGAAAMRYTESRLMPISALLLSEINKGTVGFKPNYDGQDKEPILLPARLPVLLINGIQGIAVGMASDIPPHNLREIASASIALFKNESCTLDEIMAHCPGPDFPDGGLIISSPEEIKAAYKTGRGSIKMRCSYKKEELARSQWQIVITELPYGVSTKRILEQIDALANPAPPSGKKVLTAQQSTNRQLALNLLDKAHDESSQDQPIRIVITPKTSKINAEELMGFLFVNTDLQYNVSINCTVIGIDDKPQTIGLLEILKQWNSFRFQTVTNRCKHELAECVSRIEILDGRMIVFLNIDRVISIIKDSDDPSSSLKKEFNLTERQIEDILEIRLRQLARLEGVKIEQELSEKKKRKKELEELLASKTKLTNLIISEIESDSKQFGDDRRSKFESVSELVAPKIAVLDEPVTVVVSKNMLVRVRNGHDVDPLSLTFKAGDSLLSITKTRTANHIFFLDITGREYCLKVSDIPQSRGDGTALSTLLDIQAPICQAVSGSESDEYLFVSSKGYGFRCKLGSMITRQKAGRKFLNVDEGFAPIKPTLVTSESKIALVTTDNKVLVINSSEVVEREVGKGDMLIKVDLPALLLSADSLSVGDSLSVTSSSGKSHLIDFDTLCSKYYGQRAKKGTALEKKSTVVFATLIKTTV